jgi:hypothetical protein
MLRWVVAVVVVGLIFVACGGPAATAGPDATSGPTEGSTSVPSSAQPSSQPLAPTAAGEPADPSAVAEAKGLIEAADLTDPATLQEINAHLLFTRSGGEAARAVLTTSTDLEELWTALWVYGTAEVDPAPLIPLLDHENPSLRAIAAAEAVGMGEGAGFEALAATLAEDGDVMGSEPPTSLQGFAVRTLEATIDAALTPEPATDDVAGTASEWSSWLSANSSGLVFDAGTRTWGLS